MSTARKDNDGFVLRYIDQAVCFVYTFAHSLNVSQPLGLSYTLDSTFTLQFLQQAVNASERFPIL